MQKKSPVSLNPFPLGSRLCGLFPEVKLSIAGAPSWFYSRPSFSFPFVKPPNMIPNVEESVLASDFSLKHAAPPKPEAPWIKRCDYGIKFTDEIQIIEQPSGVSETEVTTNKDEDEEEEDEDQHDEEEEEPRDKEKDLDDEQNERYYMRSYVKEQRRKMARAYSERVAGTNAEDLFGGGREEEEEEEEEMEAGKDI